MLVHACAPVGASHGDGRRSMGSMTGIQRQQAGKLSHQSLAPRSNHLAPAPRALRYEHMRVSALTSSREHILRGGCAFALILGPLDTRRLLRSKLEVYYRVRPHGAGLPAGARIPNKVRPVFLQAGARCIHLEVQGNQLQAPADGLWSRTEMGR